MLKFLVMGPKCSGKTHLVNIILKHFGEDKIQRSISYTTRDPREHEVDGVDYYFIDDSDITDEIRSLPMAEAHRNKYYYTTHEELTKHKNIIATTSVGVLQDMRETYDDVKVIYIDVYPSTSVHRLIHKRKVPTAEAKRIIERMIYTGEFNNAPEADFVFTNNKDDYDISKLINYINDNLS